MQPLRFSYSALFFRNLLRIRSGRTAPEFSACFCIIQPKLQLFSRYLRCSILVRCLEKGDCGVIPPHKEKTE